jgi:hypothetical protein
MSDTDAAWRPTVGLQDTHCAIDASGLQTLGRGQGGKDRGEALGQKNLAGTRRTDHQDIVTAGRGDQERALGVVLPLDVDEIVFVV